MSVSVSVPVSVYVSVRVRVCLCLRVCLYVCGTNDGPLGRNHGLEWRLGVVNITLRTTQAVSPIDPRHSEREKGTHFYTQRARETDLHT
jgi:hypothetical protein